MTCNEVFYAGIGHITDAYKQVCIYNEEFRENLEKAREENAKLRKLVYDLLNAWDDMQHEVVTGPTFDECERYAYELGVDI